MLTLSYGAMIGLLLAAFILGLLFPFILLIYLIVQNPPR